MLYRSPKKQLMITSILLALIISLPTMADSAITKITEVEGLSEYRLNNGLRVLLFPDETKETVTVNITYHVGSKHENYGETGMAHLLEHLLFKGTPKHKDIPKELSSHGAVPNGTTWTDRTNYFETFTATDENINWALSMEADRMVNSFIAKKDLDSEMSVVRNEFESGENSPFGVTLKRMMAAAYSWHNYGKSTIGAKSDLENMPIERLQAFYKKYYQPDNATLIVAGKFNDNNMLSLIKKYFSVIPKPNRKIHPLYTTEPAQDGEKSVTVRRVGDAQLYAVMYHIPAGSHPDYAAIDVLSKVLSATPSGRLHKNVVEKELASHSFGFNFQWQEPGLAIFGVQVDKNLNLGITGEKVLEIIEGITKTPITDKEVERAKRNILKGIELSINSSELIALNLSEWLGMGDWRLFFLHRDRVEKVTTADVQRVAQAYLQRNNRTVGRFIPTQKPERVEIPKVANVADMLKEYKGAGQIVQGEAFDPSHNNIDLHTQFRQLSNGAQLALLPKKTRGKSVVVSIAIDLGNEASLSGLRAVGEGVGSMLIRGTKKLTHEQLKDEFDRLKVDTQIGGNVLNAFAKLKTTQDNLAGVLDLIAEVFKTPGFDKKEFQQYKSMTKVNIEQQLQNPQTIAFVEYSRKQNPYSKKHPRYVPTHAERLIEIDKLKLSDLKKFHKQFYGADNMRIAIVGDFDKDKVEAQLEELYGSWRSKENFQRVADPFKKMPLKNTNFDTPDKENAIFIATMVIPIGKNHIDAPALELGNYIFGGGFLNSRLATRLRQNDGLSYGVGSFVGQNELDNKTSMAAYAICAPQNLNKVEVGFKDELAKLIKEGFTQEEIDIAKSGLLQKARVSRSQDQELVVTLTNNLFVGHTMKWSQEYEQRIKDLTAIDVHSVIKRYFKLEDFSIIKAGDMGKVESVK